MTRDPRFNDDWDDDEFDSGDDDDFDYDEFIDNEFGAGQNRSQYSLLVRLTALVLLLAFVIVTIMQLGF